MKLVPYKGQDTHPNGVAFYVNNGQGGVIGIRVYPDGRKVAVNPSTNITDGTKFPTMKRGGQRYLYFTHAWGAGNSMGKAIYASHAVYTAWREKPIPAGMTIDHIDGVSLNNDFRNLRCISNEINIRDGGFLSKLRHNGFNPACIDRAYLLRYFDRMAIIKPALSPWKYRHLLRYDLRNILYMSKEQLKYYLLLRFNIQIEFNL